MWWAILLVFERKGKESQEFKIILSYLGEFQVSLSYRRPSVEINFVCFCFLKKETEQGVGVHAGNSSIQEEGEF